MPLTEKGRKILRSMKKHYGAEKGESVFYASQKTKTITGTHEKKARRGLKRLARRKHG